MTDANGVDKVDPSDAAILEAVNLPGNPTEMAFDENGKLWVVQPDADTVTRIDPATATIEASVSVGDDPRAIVADDDGFVWVTVGGEDRVIRLSATPMSVADPPTSVSGSGGDGEVSVSWTAPADTGGTDVTGYTVTASPGGAQCATTGATSCTVTGLTNGTDYTFGHDEDIVGSSDRWSDPVHPSAHLSRRRVSATFGDGRYRFLDGPADTDGRNRLHGHGVAGRCAVRHDRGHIVHRDRPHKRHRVHVHGHCDQRCRRERTIGAIRRSHPSDTARTSPANPHRH